MAKPRNGLKSTNCMKTPVAVTLIITGALLVMTPAIADYCYQQHLVTLMSHPGVTSVNLDGKLGDVYRFGCWLTGSVMIGVAVLCSVFVWKPAARLYDQAATQPA